MLTPFTIRLTAIAQTLLAGIDDRRVREAVAARIDQLAQEPEKQGKPLKGDLIGYRSVRAVGQRYRILYLVKQDIVVVTVVALGLRKEGSRRDVYALAQKLLRQGLLAPPDEEAETPEA